MKDNKGQKVIADHYVTRVDEAWEDADPSWGEDIYREVFKADPERCHNKDVDYYFDEDKYDAEQKRWAEQAGTAFAGGVSGGAG